MNKSDNMKCCPIYFFEINENNSEIINNFFEFIKNIFVRTV